MGSSANEYMSTEQKMSNVLNRIDDVKHTFMEKRGQYSLEKNVMYVIFYIIGIIACVYVAIKPEILHLSVFNEQVCEIIGKVVGVSGAVFLLLMLLNIYNESQYYKKITSGENEMLKYEERLTCAKNALSAKDSFFTKENMNLSQEIELGEDIDDVIEQANSSIAALEMKKGALLELLIPLLYYISGASIGAVIIFRFQNIILNIITPILRLVYSASTATSISKFVFYVAAAIAVFAGPIIVKLYFNVIKEIEIDNGLPFLMISAGIMSFVTITLAALFVLLVVGFVIGIIRHIINFIKGFIKTVKTIVKIIVVLGVLAIIGGAASND